MIDISTLAALSGWGTAITQYILGKRTSLSKDEQAFRKDLKERVERLEVMLQECEDRHRNSEQFNLDLKSEILELRAQVLKLTP